MADRGRVDASERGLPNWAHRFRALTSKPFVRGISAIMGGTAFRQVIVLLVAPLLTRLYTPSDFGVLTAFTSVLATGTVVCSLTYQLAIPLPEDRESAVNVLALSVFLVLATASLATVATLLWNGPAAEWLKLPAIRDVAWLFGPAMLGAGLYQAMSYWASREGKFATLGRTKVLQGVGQDGIQTVGGFLHVGPIGLVIGYAAGQALGIGGLLRGARAPWHLVHWKRIREVARRYAAFPLYSSWAALVNVVGLQVPFLLVTHAFGGEIAGLFGLTVRVLALPTVLLGQACAQVFYPAAAKHAHSPELLSRLTSRLSAALFAVGVLAFVPLLIAGPDIFRIAFGRRWVESGRYAQVMAVWAMAALVSSPISGMVLVKGRQKVALGLTVYEATLRIGAILIGAHFKSPVLAVILFSSAGVVISIVSVLWAFHLGGVNWWHWATGRLKLTAWIVAASLVWIVLRSQVSSIVIAMIAVGLLLPAAWKLELSPLLGNRDDA